VPAAIDSVRGSDDGDEMGKSLSSSGVLHEPAEVCWRIVTWSVSKSAGVRRLVETMISRPPAWIVLPEQAANVASAANATTAPDRSPARPRIYHRPHDES
jgi:hypothetical protein